jgi:hypothetical protein
VLLRNGITYVVARGKFLFEFGGYPVFVCSINTTTLVPTLIHGIFSNIGYGYAYDVFFNEADTMVVRVNNGASSIYNRTYIAKYDFVSSSSSWADFPYNYCRGTLAYDSQYGYNDGVFFDNKYVFTGYGGTTTPFTPTILRGDLDTITTVYEEQKGRPQGHSLIYHQGNIYLLRAYYYSNHNSYWAGIQKYESYDDFIDTPLPPFSANWRDLNTIGLGAIEIYSNLALGSGGGMAFIDHTHSTVHFFDGTSWGILPFPDGVSSSMVAKFIAITNT